MTLEWTVSSARICVAVAAVLVGACPASAQVPAPPPAGQIPALHQVLRPGDVVVAGTRDGTTINAYNEGGNQTALLLPGLIGLGAGVRLDAVLVRSRTVYGGPLARSATAELARRIDSMPAGSRSAGFAQQIESRDRRWIRRHAKLVGALAGFGAGYLIGYLPGDDGIFEDFSAQFSGLVIGGIGAGIGTVAGWAASR